MPLEFADLETFYEDMARTLDAVSEDQRELFLCKLSLLMARDLGDPAKLKAMIRDARANLTEG